MPVPTDDFREGLIAALPALRRFALVLTRANADADDLLQATCERALSRWEQFAPGTRLESWLFSIMHSIWKNIARGHAIRNRVHLELTNQQHFEDGVRIANGKIAVAEVLSHLSTIDPDQAAALSLVGLHGMSYREAAKVLDIPQGTLESRVARGRVALGRLLEGSATARAATSKRSTDSSSQTAVAAGMAEGDAQ